MDSQYVTLWEDALIIYSGEKFDMSGEDIFNVFHRIYSKEYEGNDGKKRSSGISKQAIEGCIDGQVKR
jgi:hypothetical protein